MLFLLIMYVAMLIVGIMYTELYLTTLFGKDDPLTILFRLISFLPVFNLIFPIIII